MRRENFGDSNRRGRRGDDRNHEQERKRDSSEHQLISGILMQLSEFMSTSAQALEERHVVVGRDGIAR